MDLRWTDYKNFLLVFVCPSTISIAVDAKLSIADFFPPNWRVDFYCWSTWRMTIVLELDHGLQKRRHHTNNSMRMDSTFSSRIWINRLLCNAQSLLINAVEVGVPLSPSGGGDQRPLRRRQRRWWRRQWFDLIATVLKRRLHHQYLHDALGR